MAGMFYSLNETAEKLGIAEDEVKQLAADGKLREFRDGSNLLFKIDEVEALLSGEAIPDLPEDADEVLGLEPVAEEPADAEPTLELEDEAPAAEPEFEPEPKAEIEMAADTADEMDLTPDFSAAEATDDISELGLAETGEEVSVADATSEMDMDLAPDMEEATGELSEDDILAGMGSTALPAEASNEESEISLAPETGLLDAESDSDITDMDTALTGQGINVLGETDADYDVTDDSLAETVGPAGTATEASLEEIEDDVSLDSFGSGSGLLDLSLQADDTSLGGILDEIYTSDEGGEPADAGESDMLDDMTAEADHVPDEESLAVPEPMVAVPTVTPAFAEAVPDSQSNMLGILLFLPLLALLYTAIVTVSALKGVMPSILESIQNIVWYIMGGAIVVSGIVIGASFVAGAEKGPKKARAPKGKKEKKPKEKKAKKEKAPKAKKEKKPLFGKKK